MAVPNSDRLYKLSRGIQKIFCYRLHFQILEWSAALWVTGALKDSSTKRLGQRMLKLSYPIPLTVAKIVLTRQCLQTWGDKPANCQRKTQTEMQPRRHSLDWVYHRRVRRRVG